MAENEKSDESLVIPLIALGAGIFAGLVVGFILSAPDEKKKQSQAASGNRG